MGASSVTAIKNIQLFSYLHDLSDLQSKMHEIRLDLNQSFPYIHRIAIAIYDAERDMLKTDIFDEDIPSNLHNYETPLSECESLRKLASSSSERIANDLSIFDNGTNKHTRDVRNTGYLSSVTIPLLIEEKLLGFFFINSREKNIFDTDVVQQLRMLSMVFTLLLHQITAKINVLKSTIESMKIVSSHRDPETGEHLKRMARYSLLIARKIASAYQLSDVFIRYIYLYAPLHDIGKLTVPDNILLKEGPLSNKEFNIMKEHSINGYKLARNLIEVYKLEQMPFIDSMSSIIRSHHEKIDGSGYPDGLLADEIPIEARIVAVADIFDALTSKRPYKKAWTIESAFAQLKELGGTKLDQNCVDALVNNKKQVSVIMEELKDKL